MKRILLTGISGYLGRNLLKSIDQNRYEIYSLQKNTDVKYDGIKQTFTIDDDLESFMLDVCPDTILHLATFHSPKDDPFEIKRMLDANLFLGTRLLATMPSSSRFIYSGSFQQYLPNLVNYYVLTKMLFDQTVRYYNTSKGIETTQIILSDIYGEHDPRGKVLSTLLESIKREGRFHATNPGAVIHPLYIEDAVHSIIDILQQGEEFGVPDIYIKPKGTYSLNDVIDFVEDIHLGRKLKAHIPLSSVRISIPKDAEVINASTSLEDGILKLWKNLS